MKRKLCAFWTVVLTLSVLFTACGIRTGYAASTEVYKMAGGWIAAEGTTLMSTIRPFKEALESKSNHRIEFTIYHSQQISTSQREDLEKVQQGITHITSVPTYIFGEFADMMEYNLTDIPFLFNNAEEIHKIFDSELLNAINEQFEARTGVKIVGGFSHGWSIIGTTKTPFKFPADLKGLKLRVVPSEISLDTYEEWGAAPTPMAFGEVYTALQQGTIDGTNMGSAEIMYNEKFYELLKHMVYVAPTPTYHLIAVNKSFYESLPEDLRKILDECIKDWQDEARNVIEGKEGECMDLMEASGVTMIRLTTEERQVWKDAIPTTYKKASSKIGDEFIGKVEAFLASLR